MEEYKTKVRTFLSRYVRKVELQDDDDVFSMGALNSLFAMQLVMFIEKEFSIRLENNDINMDHFRSINSITTLVYSKLQKA